MLLHGVAIYNSSIHKYINICVHCYIKCCVEFVSGYVIPLTIFTHFVLVFSPQDLKYSLLCLCLVGSSFFTMAQVVEDEDLAAHGPVCSVEEVSVFCTYNIYIDI